MTKNEFDDLISTLDSKRPLRIIRLSTKDIASLEWKPCNQPWEHLMSIPNGPIYKIRHSDYRAKELKVPHQSLFGVYKKLSELGLISSAQKHLFLN